MELDDALLAASQLLARCRWGSLASQCEDGSPLASQVAIAPDASSGSLILHLSELAQHTRNLMCNAPASVVVGEPDIGGEDPQTLARITVVGSAAVLSPEGRSYATARAAYLRHLPAAEPRFQFGDFALYAIRPHRAQFVGGFAWAFGFDDTQSTEVIRAAARIISGQ